MTILPVDIPVEQLKQLMRESEQQARVSDQSVQPGIHALLSGRLSGDEKKSLETMFSDSFLSFVDR